MSKSGVRTITTSSPVKDTVFHIFDQVPVRIIRIYISHSMNGVIAMVHLKKGRREIRIYIFCISWISWKVYLILKIVSLLHQRGWKIIELSGPAKDDVNTNQTSPRVPIRKALMPFSAKLPEPIDPARASGMTQVKLWRCIRFGSSRRDRLSDVPDSCSRNHSR